LLSLTLLWLIAGATVTPASAQSTGVSYVYDALGRLLAVYDSSSNAAVYQYDAVGNLLSIVNYSSNQPSAFHLSSNTGQTGSTFIIYGTGFCASPTVTIDGIAATVSSSSATQIVVIVPSGASSGAVVVTCGSNQINAGTFTVASSMTPSISGFTPTIGAAGTAVTINGSNFQPSAAADILRFNDIAALVTSATASALGTTVPGDASTGHVSVTTLAGQSVSSGYFFVPPPPATVSSIAVTGQIAIGGSSVNAALNTPGTQALFAFDGTAGQQISLNLTNQSFNGNDNVNYYIIPPGGSTSNATASLVSWTSSNIIADVTLPTTGTYTVFVDPVPNNTGSVTLQLFATSDVTGTISIGGPPVNVTIATPGQDASLTFSGTAGQQISLNLTNQSFNGNDNVKYYILQPGGSTSNAIASLLSWTSGNIIADVTLPTTGTYTLFVDPIAANTGTVTLQVFATSDVTGSISIGGPPVNLAIATPGQDASLTFSGTAGQQISLNLTNQSFNGNDNVTYYIIPPGGGTSNATASLVSWTSSNIIVDVTLPTTGTYTVFVDPAAGNTGSVTMQLFATSDVTGTMSIGGPPVNVTIATPGQDASLTFSGTAGQQISLSLTNQSFSGNDNVTYYIIPPGGTTSNAIASLVSWTSGNIIANVTLPTTGTYTIFVDPVAGNTGSVTLQL